MNLAIKVKLHFHISYKPAFASSFDDDSLETLLPATVPVTRFTVGLLKRDSVLGTKCLAKSSKVFS